MTGNAVYHRRITRTAEYLLKMHFGHGVRVAAPLEEKVKLRYYVGKGNNGEIIRLQMKKRFWWTPCSDPLHANFLWTQYGMQSYY